MAEKAAAHDAQDEDDDEVLAGMPGCSLELDNVQGAPSNYG